MDRISGLSDELLVKILLLVPTKVAVSTSILSKRWEYLWMWLPKLAYGRKGCSESEYEKLQCFLDRNLPLHRAPVIQSFRLGLYNSRFKPENIKMWVLIAVSHCVRELEILYKSYPANPNILPSNLYTCNSLVILKLGGGMILLDVPRMVSLPSLKTLQLLGVTYFKDETLQRLLSNCPILEELMVFLRERDTTRKLTVVVPSLQRLALYISYDHHIDGFVIETPSLKDFKLEIHSTSAHHYFLIEDMPNLIEANIFANSIAIDGVIRSITSVKRLAICPQAMFGEGFVFNQLEHLEVCTCPMIFSNQLVRLLKASSKLKKLDIALTDGHMPRGMGDWNQPSTVPECLMSSLQTLNWSTYTGKPQERDTVVYILKHARHLKTATIKSSESSGVSKFEMLKELALCSRASASREVMFE